MPKTLDTQGFSGLREEVVRSEGRPSGSSVQQALIRTYFPTKPTKIPEFRQFRDFSGSMSIVEVEPKQNHYRIVSGRKLRHDFHMLQKRILFLRLLKLRMPNSKKVRDELRDLAVHKANYEELRDLEEREKRKEKEYGRE